MQFGLTIWLNCYTDTQYALVSTALKELAFRVLGVVMLYFNMGVKQYIGAAEYVTARNAAGWAGMVFTTASAIDAVLRHNNKKLRIFDELAIVSIFVTIWAMFFSMFEHISILFMCLCGISIFIGIFSVVHKECVGLGNVPPPPNSSVQSLLDAVKHKPEASEALLTATLILAVMDGENPNTIALVEAVKERYRNANTNA